MEMVPDFLFFIRSFAGTHYPIINIIIHHIPYGIINQVHHALEYGRGITIPLG